MEYYPQRPPEEWATGGEPMTERQANWLWNLAGQNGIAIPFLSTNDRNSQNVTKAEAHTLISMILDGVLPTKEYLSSLGHDPNPHSPPPHPREWRYCHHWPTEMQMAWLNRLATGMCVPQDVKERGLFGLTRGQASLLIGILRAEKDKGTIQDPTAAFQRAVKDARDQLPVPEGDDAKEWAKREGFAFNGLDE